MPATDTALANLDAQWYNSLVAALTLSPSEFQVAQGNLLVPEGSEQMWQLMDQIPIDATTQYYTPDSVTALSSLYRTILGDTKAPQNDSFVTAMGASYSDWQAAELAYYIANKPFATPTAQFEALTAYFSEWSSIYMDPSQGATCYTLYAPIYDNPTFVGQQLINNLSSATGAVAAYNLPYSRLLDELKVAGDKTLSLNSSTTSSDTSNSWASSSSSTGGSYFYSTSSSSQSSDFTQKFAGSGVTVETSFAHAITIPVTPLSSGVIVDTTVNDPSNPTGHFGPWFYPGALTQAYQNNNADVWHDPSQWNKFFSDTGSLQYLVTSLIVVDGISQVVTSDAVYTDDDQSYAHSEESEGYGCWPYYVSNSSSSTTQTHHHFDDEGHLKVTTTSPVGSPVIIGVLVSSGKALETGTAGAAEAEVEAEPAE